MTQGMLFLVATSFLLSNAFADILVQPGYGQPHAGPLQRALEKKHENHQADPGYHLEVQPVYPDSNQAQPPVIGYPLLPHHLLPKYRKHLRVAKLGGLSHLAPSYIIGQPHVPLPVHNRYRRSATAGTNSGDATREPKNAVAQKPTLSETSPPIVDLQDQLEQAKDLDEKRIETRQSKNNYVVTAGGLLGLPASGFNNQIVQQLRQHPETPESNPQKTQRLETQSPQTVSYINPENLQHAMLLQSTHNTPTILNLMPQQTAPLKNAQPIDEHQLKSAMQTQTPIVNSQKAQAIHFPIERNFPDPRPVVSHATPIRTSRFQSEPALKTAQVATPVATRQPSNVNEIVSTKLAKLHAPRYQYVYATPAVSTYTPSYNYVPYGSYDCPCTTAANYVVYKSVDGASSNFETMKTSTPRTAQIYITEIEGSNYSPQTSYAVLPESYNNYGLDYAVPYYARPVPVQQDNWLNFEQSPVIFEEF